jgi:predicted cupin superfamily sugar epimerase
VETDRAPDTVPSPFPGKGFDPVVRNSSTTIFYLLTPNVPQGASTETKDESYIPYTEAEDDTLSMQMKRMMKMEENGSKHLWLDKM